MSRRSVTAPIASATRLTQLREITKSVELELTPEVSSLLCPGKMGAQLRPQQAIVMVRAWKGCRAIMPRGNGAGTTLRAVMLLGVLLFTRAIVAVPPRSVQR